MLSALFHSSKQNGTGDNAPPSQFLDRVGHSSGRHSHTFLSHAQSQRNLYTHPWATTEAGSERSQRSQSTSGKCCCLRRLRRTRRRQPLHRRTKHRPLRRHLQPRDKKRMSQSDGRPEVFTTSCWRSTLWTDNPSPWRSDAHTDPLAHVRKYWFAPRKARSSLQVESELWITIHKHYIMSKVYVVEGSETTPFGLRELQFLCRELTWDRPSPHSTVMSLPHARD